MSAANDWLERLYALAARFSGCGACADIADLSIADAWGLYRYLSRLAESA